MKISTKGRYALSLMAYLAKNYEADRYISLKEISEKENISLKYLEKIIISLNKNNFLDSHRGTDGGYKLKNAPKEYSLYEIISSAEGGIEITSCLSEDFRCLKKESCRSYKLWNELNQVIKDFLSNKTLEEYIRK